MSDQDHSVELTTNATLAGGLALLALVALGGGGLVGTLDGVQIAAYLSGGNQPLTAVGGFGGGILAGHLGGYNAGAIAASGAAGGPVGIGIGVVAGAL